MPMTPSEVEQVIKDFGQRAKNEWARLARIDAIVAGDHNKPNYESSAEARKYDKLWKDSTINLVGLVANAYGQRMSVDGYRARERDQQDATTPWQIWVRSGMRSRQKRFVVGAFVHGYSYLFVGPSNEAPGAALKPVSARQVWCYYEDPDDDFPTFALQFKSGVWTVWDDEQTWTVPNDKTGQPMRTHMMVAEHGTGKVPFSRIEADWGTSRGSGIISPLIPLNDMINRLTFVLNLIAENSSFALRYITGVEMPVNPDTGKAVEPHIGPNKIFTLPEANGKMGQLDPSDPTGIANYRAAMIENFFSLAQLPPHYSVGRMANLSAEALIAAESTFAFALEDFTLSFSGGIDRALRLASAIAGDIDAAQNTDAEVWWRSVSAKSLNSEVEAWAKAVTELGVPQQAAWARLPGVTHQDVNDWIQMKQDELDADPLTQLKELMGDGTGADSTG